MTNPKWEIGPVKLVGGLEAYLDYFCEARQVWIGRFKNAEGKWYGADWTIEGRHENLAPTMHLVPPPKKKVRVKGWLNVDADGMMIGYDSKGQADREAFQDRILCLPFDLGEVEEGEGLS